MRFAPTSALGEAETSAAVDTCGCIHAGGWTEMRLLVAPGFIPGVGASPGIGGIARRPG